MPHNAASCPAGRKRIPTIGRKERAMKYPDITWSRMQAVIDKLGGMEGVQRFLSGELVVNKTVERSFTIFKTITLGAYQSSSEYRKALNAKGYHIGECADQIFNKINVGETVTQPDLVVKTVAKLGFKNGATRQQIYDRAIKLGLELCLAEVGPALRLAYQDQPHGKWLLIAMELITDSDGLPRVFAVGHNDDERWLGSEYDYPDHFWYADRRWVFVAPRK